MRISEAGMNSSSSSVTPRITLLLVAMIDVIVRYTTQHTYMFKTIQITGRGQEPQSNWIYITSHRFRPELLLHTVCGNTYRTTMFLLDRFRIRKVRVLVSERGGVSVRTLESMVHKWDIRWLVN